MSEIGDTHPSSDDLGQIDLAFQRAWTKGQRVSADPGADVSLGLETRNDPSNYSWDGVRRGGDPAHPYIIFQYTLAGFGAYAEGGVVHRLSPGLAFVAVVPSEHRYYLPLDSSQWKFFWMIVRHPYVVSRLIRAARRSGAVIPIEPRGALMSRAVRLFEGLCSASFLDALASEQALFDFLFEFERFAEHRAFPQARRQALLDQTRQRILQGLASSLTVDDLARAHGMSRSHFGHFFKSATGLSPAKFTTEVRLQEVSRRLLETGATLKSIARETGFADANHLCKVFRRFYHTTPAAFRREMR